MKKYTVKSGQWVAFLIKYGGGREANDHNKNIWWRNIWNLEVIIDDILQMARELKIVE